VKRMFILVVAVGVMAGALEVQAEVQRLASTWEAKEATSSDNKVPGSLSPGNELKPNPEQTLWVRGEVVSASSGFLVVEYYDYKVGGKVKLKIKTDSKTVFGNCSGLSSIRRGKYVSVDYKIDGTGQAIAQAVSVNADESSDWSGGA